MISGAKNSFIYKWIISLRGIVNEILFLFSEDLQTKTNQITELNEKIRELNLKILTVEQTYETTRRQCHTLQRNLQTVTEDRDDLKNRLNVCSDPIFIHGRRNS